MKEINWPKLLTVTVYANVITQFQNYSNTFFKLYLECQNSYEAHKLSVYFINLHRKETY